jgi:hypothetical protein
MPGRTARTLLILPCLLLLAACGGGPAIQSSAPAGASAYSQLQGSAGQLPGPSGVAPLPANPSADRSVATAGAGNAAGASAVGSPPGSAAAGPGPSSIPASLGTPQGRVERTVSARYVVPHGGFLDAFGRVVARTTSLGGYVVDSSSSPDSSGRISSGAITVKVPAARLSELISGLPSDFTVSSLNYGSQDHTAETVDLSARLAASIAHRTALERLRDRTGSIAEVASLEQQIAQVQLEVDQVQGALNALNGRVDLATASIALAEKDARPAVAPAPQSDPALLQALRTGAGNALQLMAGAVLVAMTVLPVVLLVAAAWLARRPLRRVLGIRPAAAAVPPPSA